MGKSTKGGNNKSEEESIRRERYDGFVDESVM